MVSARFPLFSIAGCALALASAMFAADEPPTEWIDADTGHRVVRLSREGGTASLYFHQNSYTPAGDKMVVTTASGGIAAINLRTREITPVVEGKVGVLVVGRKTGNVYYVRRTDGATTVYAADLDTRVERRIARIERGGVASLNADETLLLGSHTEGETPRPPGEAAKPAAPENPPTSHAAASASGAAGPRPQGEWMQPAPAPQHGPDGKPYTFAEQKEMRLNRRLEQRLPMAIFTIDTKTGEQTIVHRATDWLNHLQFSPADPRLIMFCHEGPWHKVDRIWTIRTDGTGLTKVHTRTMNMEIAGHEFFGADGTMLWYDLQTPRGEDFWLAGLNLTTRARTWYHLNRDEWSVHFNVSPDGKLFAGDGGDEEMVAHAKDGKWIWLFRPREVPDVAGIHAANSKDLINPGVLEAERLVNMARHNYQLEPNVTFTPDMKWIVFRSNMHGPTHVYAVEIAKAK